MATESTTTLNRDEPDATKPKISFKNKLLMIKNSITIEPVLFVYLFASTLAGGAVHNMMFEMSCRSNLGLNDTICSDISIGQKYVKVVLAEVIAWTEPIPAIVSGILVLCFSSLSDRYKWRKPFFIWPVFGEVFSAIGVILCTVFISRWPVELFFFFVFILPSFFGGGQTVIMAVYSYISDISTKEERTSRIGFVELISLILTPIAPAISGILFVKIGYYGIYFICLFLFAFAVLYGLMFIKEKKPQLPAGTTLCVDLFNVKTILLDMIKVISKKRSGCNRLLLILTYICYILLMGPQLAQIRYVKIYAIDTFSWKVDKFGYFEAFDHIVHILGMLLAVTIFTKKLQLNDVLIACISAIFKIIVGVWYAFSNNLILFCLGPLVSIFSGLFIIALRSFVTKIVDTSEIAKAQAFFAICQAITPSIYSGLYAKFYKATTDSFHSAFFLLSSVLVTPALLILMVMYILYKQSSQVPLEENKENQNDIEIERL